MRYIKFLYLKYFLGKLPKTVEICLKKSRPAGYFFVGVYVAFKLTQGLLDMVQLKICVLPAAKLAETS